VENDDWGPQIDLVVNKTLYKQCSLLAKFNCVQKLSCAASRIASVMLTENNVPLKRQIGEAFL
jgi:hypothetical protein